MRALGFLWRGAILFVASIVTVMATYPFITVAPGPFPPEGPLPMVAAMLVVHALTVATLLLIVARSSVRGAALGLLLFVALFTIQTAMMQIETIAFNQSVNMPLASVGALVTVGAIHAGVLGALAAWLFRGPAEGAAPAPPGLIWRIPATTIAYVVAYFTAGALLAWSHAAVRDYYEQGIHIDERMVLALQLARGLLWSLIALFIALRLRGPGWARVLTMAVVFMVFASAQLLYPNSYMPPAVASAHMVELAVSEAIWGAIAALLLGPVQRKL